MITVSLPDRSTADAVGDLGPDVRIVLWDPQHEDCPEGERDRIALACVPHASGGRRALGRMADLPHLRVIQIPSAGFEHAVPHVPEGVVLANARGVHDARVAEMTLALALASRRRLPQFLDAQRRGVWEPDQTAPSLADSRALIVGYGSIGEAIARRLRACEVEVEGVARAARVAEDGTVVHAVADLATAVARADIVVVVAPHSEETDRLIGAEVLAAMPDGALLINVGRGRVVDTEALLVELEAGRLHAALDVTDPEPLPDSHPLWSAPHCIVVPHVAGSEPLDGRRYASLVRRQVEALRAGHAPVNQVWPPR